MSYVLLLCLFFVSCQLSAQLSFPNGLVLPEAALKTIVRGGIPTSFSKFSSSQAAVIRQSFLWHFSFPTTGLLVQEPFFPPKYPFLPHFFTLNELAPHQGAGIKVGLLDTGFSGPLFSFNDHVQNFDVVGKKPWLTPQACRIVAGHGMYSASLITNIFVKDSRIVSLAPQASLLMLKVFDGCGISNIAQLDQAISQAVQHDASIVSLSFKLDVAIDRAKPETKKFEELLQKIPYIVAASGNSDHEIIASEAYPAKLPMIPFDVGAFGFNGIEATIPNFSQYERGVGPLFVTPGQNVASAWSVVSGEINYLFFSGTSVATSFMAGTLALILGQADNDFTREQILTICYASTLKLHNNADWQNKVVLGVLDLRMALCTLHTIRFFKNYILEKKINFDIAQNFGSLICALRTIFLDPVRRYAKNFSKSVIFEQEFVDYWQEALNHKDAWPQEQKNYFITRTLGEALNFWSEILAQAIEGSSEKKSALVQEVKTVLFDRDALKKLLPETARTRLYYKGSLKNAE
jgi:hypothetical protein